MLISWKDYISESENVGERPYITGTDIPVSQVLDLLAFGKSIDDLVKEYTELEYEHIFACLEYSRQKK